MKIILHSEARTISNSKLARNQQDLIDLISKLRRFDFGLQKKRQR